MLSQGPLLIDESSVLLKLMLIETNYEGQKLYQQIDFKNISENQSGIKLYFVKKKKSIYMINNTLPLSINCK